MEKTVCHAVIDRLEAGSDKPDELDMAAELAYSMDCTAALAMGDALAIALMQVRHFKPRDFAQFHPGGELGKRLLTTAEDVMRSDDMPIIPKDMHLGEAIIHVSKGKLGLGISLDEDQRVIALPTP